MKTVVSLIILFSAIFCSAQVVAECSANRNVDIVITKPDSLYTDHGDGTVTDSASGLMWQKCSLGQSGNNCIGTALVFTWQAALAAANINADSGYTDWRLPNKNELASLLEDACFNPAINTSIFPSTVADHYWSSSPYALNSLRAWDIYFYYGHVYYDVKSDSNYVRLVRGSP